MSPKTEDTLAAFLVLVVALAALGLGGVLNRDGEQTPEQIADVGVQGGSCTGTYFTLDRVTGEQLLCLSDGGGGAGPTDGSGSGPTGFERDAWDEAGALGAVVAARASEGVEAQRAALYDAMRRTVPGLRESEARHDAFRWWYLVLLVPALCGAVFCGVRHVKRQRQLHGLG